MAEREAPYFIEVLAKHDRSSFSCGTPALDRYFKTQVSQDIRRRITSCFVAVSRATDAVAGFYTLSAASLLMRDLSPIVAKKLPRYPLLPAIRMGRLAVDLHHAGKGLGGAMLADAVARGLRSDIAAFALVVDAKNETAVAFYEHHGFAPLASFPFTLFLALGSANRLLR